MAKSISITTVGDKNSEPLTLAYPYPIIAGMTNSLKKFTTLDALETKLIEDAQITPDGLHVAFVVADRYTLDTKKPKASIWLVGASGGDARPFTAGPRRDYYPRWSPDSHRLAFLS